MLHITCTDGSTYSVQGEIDLDLTDGLFVSVAEMSRLAPEIPFTCCQSLADFLSWLGF